MFLKGFSSTAETKYLLHSSILFASKIIRKMQCVITLLCAINPNPNGWGHMYTYNSRNFEQVLV
jgi:hypothetical protein